MITIVFGKPGSGKTAFLTANAAQYLNGSALDYDFFSDCKNKVTSLNETGFDFSLPAHAPVYSNYPILVPAGYNKSISSYYIDGFHLGFVNDNVDVISVLPNSKIYLSEAQRYYNSRKSRDLPDWVSRFFEEHRHYGLDIMLDVQRPGLIDVNIRDIAGCFVEVEKIEQQIDKKNDYIISTDFKIKVFEDWKFVESYINGSSQTYVEETRSFPFDVFDYYESQSYFRNFLPRKNFDYIEHHALFDVEQDAELAKIMYRQTAPDGFYSSKKG